MRPHHTLIAIAMTSAALVAAVPTFAQYQGGGSGGPGGGRGADQQQQDDAAKKKRDKEWNGNLGGMAQPQNAGPCPYVKVLYDAARYVEFKDSREASAAVGYTGEIENISSACAYKAIEPIRVAMQVLFELGRGPQAQGSRKDYHYWVAVTDRNHAVLSKEWFTLPVVFPAGKDRVTLTETLAGVRIPRANSNVSGSNFEVLIGFEVTPAMAAFNRDGKRFRPNAGQVTAQAPAASPTP
ncbi:MAG TPA: Tat pathway signal sequence domain protein [Caulobacteraceae bacterium]|nr:Tat pathway signal sequence domain protein [Caulobacteraceae bacterium]